jgi:hypothetical protein
MQALAKATAATTNSTIELILTPRPRAGYAGIKSRVGFRMITSFRGNGFIAGLRRRSGARFCPAPRPSSSNRKRTSGKGQPLSVTCYNHLLSEEATMVRFIQATISGGKKVYFNADRISAILESSRSDSKSIVYTSGDTPFQVMEDPATLLQQLGVSSV